MKPTVGQWRRVRNRSHRRPEDWPCWALRLPWGGLGMVRLNEDGWELRSTLHIYELSLMWSDSNGVPVHTRRRFRSPLGVSLPDVHTAYFQRQRVVDRMAARALLAATAPGVTWPPFDSIRPPTGGSSRDRRRWRRAWRRWAMVTA